MQFLLANQELRIFYRQKRNHRVLLWHNILHTWAKCIPCYSYKCTVEPHMCLHRGEQLNHAKSPHLCRIFDSKLKFHILIWLCLNNPSALSHILAPQKIVTFAKSVCWSIDKSMGVYHHVVKRCFCRVPSLPSLTKYSPLFPIDIVIGHVAPSSYRHCDRAGSYWHCDWSRRADADVLHLVEVPAGGWVAALCDF